MRILQISPQLPVPPDSGGRTALYGWLRSRYPGHQVKEQGLMECHQHMTDKMTIVTSDGRDVVVYFDVSEHYGKGLP